MLALTITWQSARTRAMSIASSLMLLVASIFSLMPARAYALPDCATTSTNGSGCRIKTAAAGNRCLDATGGVLDGAPMELFDCLTVATHPNQRFLFDPVPGHSGYYRLRFPGWSYCLSGLGTTLAVQSCRLNTEGSWQWWKMVPSGSNNFQLKLYYDGKCADASNGGTANGTPIIKYACLSGHVNQLWTL